jgi:hypothetical protein
MPLTCESYTLPYTTPLPAHVALGLTWDLAAAESEAIPSEGGEKPIEASPMVIVSIRAATDEDVGR